MTFNVRNYETEIMDIEQNIFDSPVKMKLTFYFIDLSLKAN